MSDVEVVGDYAYCAMAYGLLILDVSNPAAPSFVSKLYMQGGDGASSVAVAGNYAYVAANGYSDWSLVIVNIANPAAPVLAGSYDTPGYALGVAVAGNYAYVAAADNDPYVADDTSDLVIVNVADPAAPVLAGSYDTPGSAWGVAVAGDYAYVADVVGFLILSISAPAGVDDDTPVPASFQLGANYPNPFNPSTTIAFELALPGLVQLHVFNVLGQKVATLVDRLLPAGRQEVTWDGGSASDGRATSGVYFYTLTVGDQLQTRKMLLLK